MQKLIELGLKQPKKLFLIDGLGALLSAFMLGIVLVKFDAFFGVSASTLYLLAFFPILFAWFDFICFVKKDLIIPFFLKAIAVLNAAYCVLSLVILFFLHQNLTIWAWLYFLSEIGIIIFLVRIELVVAKRLAEISN